VAGVDGSNVLARADVLRQLQGFDADYFAYYEDVDLCARAWALGYVTVFNPAMKVWHRRGGSSDRVPRKRAFLAARNQIVTVAKHFPNDAWRWTVFRLAVDHFLSALLGHAGGVRTRNATRLNRDQRVGLFQAAGWTVIHTRALHAKRRATVDAGQHDEGYKDRLRTLARA
jgi:GT2 family glycosyltransferase